MGYGSGPTSASAPPGAMAATEGDLFSRIGVVGLATLLIPMLSLLEVSLVGRLFVPEMLLAALLPFLLMARGHHLLRPFPQVFLVLIVVWMIGQVATDLYRDIPSSDYLRGWAKILFTGICFSSIYLLINNRPERIVLYFMGIAAGTILDINLTPSSTALEHPWKFGWAFPVTFSVFIAAVFASRLPFLSGRAWSALLAAIIGLLNLYLGFRSLGGVCLMASIYLGVWSFFAKPNRVPKPIKLSTVVLFSIAIVSFGLVIVESFSAVAKQGYLGRSAQEKFIYQGSGKFGLLLGGRQEILTSSRAVQESPVLGHGSWAKDPELTYHYAVFEHRRRIGYDAHDYVSTDLLPTHSHLFGAWVESGIIGAVFWIWILTLVARALVVLYRGDERLTPILVILAFQLLWDIPFSPFGAERRFTTTFFVIAMMWAIDRAGTARRQGKSSA